MSAIRRAKPYVLLFGALSVIYHSNLRPIAAGDSLPAALIPYSILFDHSLALDRFGPWMWSHLWYSPSLIEKSRGHWYSAYPVAGPVLITPLYVPVLAFPAAARQSPETLLALARITEKFMAVILAAGAAIWTLLLLERLAPRRWAWGLTLVFALGTTTWSTSSQALWQHTFGQVAIVASLYGLARWETEAAGNRWLWLCGAGAGIALAVRPTNLWLLPALAAALWIGRATIRDYSRLILPVIIAAGPVELYNWMAFGRVAGGYALRFDGNFAQSIAGLLFSPGRGLLVYTPVALFAAAVWLPAAREARHKHRSLLTACVIFPVLHISTIAKWYSWWGGFSWGPRLLTEITVCLVILMGMGVAALQPRGLRILFVAAAVFGCLVQALGVYCYPKGRWDQRPISVDSVPGRLWDWADNPIVRTARGGVVWEPYVIVTAALTGGVPAAAKKLQEYRIKTY
ncbi:MAG: hypothetical protein LAP40_17555 [Acidobacteriia bacterium]|nr:hypothetical protein [Terriglobia bacterium]